MFKAARESLVMTVLPCDGKVLMHCRLNISCCRQFFQYGDCQGITALRWYFGNRCVDRVFWAPSRNSAIRPRCAWACICLQKGPWRSIFQSCGRKSLLNQAFPSVGPFTGISNRIERHSKRSRATRFETDYQFNGYPVTRSTTKDLQRPAQTDTSPRFLDVIRP
jgi:hypothetical protein